LTTLPDAAQATQMADVLVGRRLAACVNIGAPSTSVYPWRGTVEHDTEVVLQIKTAQRRYAELQAAIVELHPYELPEVIAVPIINGLPGYLAWIDTCTEDS
jgi:periplasmic divalent cation tolerance protein